MRLWQRRRGDEIQKQPRSLHARYFDETSRARGFLHSVQYGKPSLVCDIQELYRHLMDDFVIHFCQGLEKSGFTVKSENVSRKRKGKREYLNNAETRRMMKKLNEYFKSKVDIPLLKHGDRQRIETLINEEALLLAKYLRDERKTWVPRIRARVFFYTL